MSISGGRMKVYAIGDLHLLGGTDKQMDVFGPNWEGHAARISDAWRSCVAGNDIVLIPGDISWAMRLEDAAEDIAFIGALPGRKVVIRGNHDYWWAAIGRVRALADPGTWFIQNDAVKLDGVVICGTRGWFAADVNATDDADARIFRRELTRLELSLQAAARLGGPIFAMLHYPPFDEKRRPTAFCELFSDYGVRDVVYGHLHGPACKNAREGEYGGVRYHLCSADGVGFTPRLIAGV